MPTEVRSPWSHEGGRTSSADRPIGRSPLSSRADAHIAPHVGKNALRHAPRRQDSDLSLQTSNAKFPSDGDNRFRR
jgi:hypothetical protein